MDVFVIPFGRERYELYCEPSAEPDAPSPRGTGLFAALRHRFTEMLRAAEQRRAQGAAVVHEPAASRLGRLQEHIFAWVAERVAEQRLLWNLRRETAAVAAHPQDMTADQVLALIRRMLRRDHDRHRRWAVIDAVVLTVSAVLAPLPGPNLLSYYFAFLVVGHWFSMRGAAQGLHRVTWTARPCPPLTDLRDLGLLEPSAREARVQDVASRLGLDHLASFVGRIAADVRTGPRPTPREG